MIKILVCIFFIINSFRCKLCREINLNSRNELIVTTKESIDSLKNDNLYIRLTESENKGINYQFNNVEVNELKGNISDDEINKFTESIFELELKNISKFIQINLQSTIKEKLPTPLPLIVISEDLFKALPIFEKMRKLFKHFNRYVGVTEKFNEQQINEQNDFVVSVISTKIMQKLRELLIQKGYVTTDPNSFKGLIAKIWFELYSRKGNRKGSCGFEHVFMSELKDKPKSNTEKEIIGLHNWVYFAENEKTNAIDYLGYTKRFDLGYDKSLMKLSFKFENVQKPTSSIFVGTTPEFEMALYTLCFLFREGEQTTCNIRLNNKHLSIKSFKMPRPHKLYIGSVFPII